MERKLPTSSSDVSWSDLIIALWRLRPHDLMVRQGSPVDVLLQRLLHLFAQAVELGVEEDCVSICPDATLAAQVHPYQKQARSLGNTALKQSLVQRFMSRGGGFVSTKNECTLRSLQILPPRSNFGSKTSAEYAARTLIKVNDYLTAATEKHRVLNFCFDAAMVGEEHVSRN